MCVALVASRSQVGVIEDGLAAGAFGSVMLAVLQAFWAPTLVIWGLAWLTGAGFSLGAGSIVSPFSVQLGMLPSLPVFGAVPAVGAPPWGMAFWLAVPIVAGVAAAWVVIRAQEAGDVAIGARCSIETGAAIGCATGVVAGMVATVATAISRGDLGTARLTGLGPLVGSMVLLAPALIGFGGVVTGIVLAARHREASPKASPKEPPKEPAKAKPAEKPAGPKPPPQPWLDGNKKGHIA